MKHYVAVEIAFEDEPCFHKDGTVEFPEEADVLRVLKEYGFDARRSEIAGELSKILKAEEDTKYGSQAWRNARPKLEELLSKIAGIKNYTKK